MRQRQRITSTRERKSEWARNAARAEVFLNKKESIA